MYPGQRPLAGMCLPPTLKYLLWYNAFGKIHTHFAEMFYICCIFASMSEQVEPEPEQDGTGPTKLAPALDCHCGAVPTSVIEAILLDPRNRSHQYWRERHAELIIHSHANLQVSLSIQNRPEDTLPAGWERERDELSGSHYYVNPMTGELRLEPPPAESWSREVELLGRSFTPQNMYDTARLRVAIAENLEIRKELERLEEARNEVLSPAEMALAELRMQVIDALDRGGSIRCPRCGVRAIKDDVRCALQCCLCFSAPLFPHFLVLASLASVSLANVRYHISKRRDFWFLHHLSGLHTHGLLRLWEPMVLLVHKRGLSKGWWRL